MAKPPRNEEEKPLFEVVNRRKTAHIDVSEDKPTEAPPEEGKAGPPPAAEPEAPAEEARPPSPEEEARVREELLEALYPDDVYTVFRSTIALLANMAWQKMGLVPDPKTQKTAKDMDQARAAIDVVAFVVERVSERADEEEKRDLASLVANLKINFVQQSQ